MVNDGDGALNRLIRAQYGDYGVDYTYDNAGRRQTEIASGTKSYNRTYTYGDIGRLTQVEDSVSGTVITLDYDANGNMRHKTTTPQTGDPTTQEFSYDIRDNLRKVTNTGTGEVQGLYEYDHAGRRVRQESPSEVLHSTYDSDQLTHEWNGTHGRVECAWVR